MPPAKRKAARKRPAKRRPVKRAPKKTSVVDAAKKSRRDGLVALRDVIAEQINSGVPPRDLASLSLRLMAAMEELELLDARPDDEEEAGASTPDEAWESV